MCAMLRLPVPYSVKQKRERAGDEVARVMTSHDPLQLQALQQWQKAADMFNLNRCCASPALQPFVIFAHDFKHAASPCHLHVTLFIRLQDSLHALQHVTESPVFASQFAMHTESAHGDPAIASSAAIRLKHDLLVVKGRRHDDYCYPAHCHCPYRHY